MRKSAFALPLALVVLITLASVANMIYQEQSTVINHLRNNKASEKASLRDELISISYPKYANTFRNVEKQFIELDGLFNVNHLVETTAFEKRLLNDIELKKFRSLLAACELPDVYSRRITSFLLADSIPANNFTTLDLLAKIGANKTDIPKALMCFRIVSPVRKVNLRYVSPLHAPILLGLDKVAAEKMLRAVRNGELLTKSQFIAALQLSDLNSNTLKFYQNLMISPNSHHAATFWTYFGETFAYIEKKFDVVSGWKHLANKILWLPNLEK